MDSELLSAITPQAKHNRWYLAHKQDSQRLSLGTTPLTTNTAPGTRGQQCMWEVRDARYQENMRVVNDFLTFPILRKPGSPLPHTRRRPLRMEMRIVDFLHDEGVKSDIADWARRLGFEITVDRVAVE